MPKIINVAKIKAEAADDQNPERLPAKNMEIMAMRAGKRPLHGTKTLVSMAISRSRGESMIRQPITPTALHPKPIHMVYIILYEL